MYAGWECLLMELDFLKVIIISLLVNVPGALDLSSIGQYFKAIFVFGTFPLYML